MASNVLPNAPAYEQTETQTKLYPVLQTQPDNNFHMQKANEVLKYLSDEVSHYRLVAKKYERTKTIINYSCFSAVGISGLLSAGGVAAAFTGIGIAAAIPIGCVASLFGLTLSCWANPFLQKARAQTYQTLQNLDTGYVKMRYCQPHTVKITH